MGTGIWLWHENGSFFLFVNVELHIEIQDGQLIHDTILPHLSTGAILLYIGGSFILLLKTGNTDPRLFPIRNINIFRGGLQTEPNKIALFSIRLF